MADTAALREQVVRAVAWAAAARIAGQILNWLMTLTVVRFLRPADYGLMAITMAVTGFLAAMSYVGFADVLVQRRDEAGEHAREAFGLIIVANLLLLAILFAAAPLCAAFYHDPRLTPLLRVASLSFLLLAAGSVSRASLQRALALKQMSAIDMGANVLAGLMTILLAWRGFGVWSLLAGFLSAETLRMVGFWTLAPARHWPALPGRRQGGMLRAGTYRTAEHMAWYVSTQIDILLTGRLLGSGALGIYSLARTLASLPVDKLAMVVKPVGLPAFSRLQDDPEQAVFYLGKSMRVLALLSLPVFVGLSAVAPEFVGAVLGASWADAATPLAILALGMTTRPAGLFLSPFLLGFGHFRVSLINTVACTLLFAAAYTIGVRWGVNGVCVAAAIAYPIQFLFLVHRVTVVRAGCFRLLLHPLLRPGLAALLMYLAVRAAAWTLSPELSPQNRLALLVGVGMVAYALGSCLLCRDIIGELASLVGLDGRFRRRASPAGAISS